VSETRLEILERYLRVSGQIEEAAVSSGRQAKDVQLVVVSKAQPMSVMEAALDAGIWVFGENYPEEAAEKVRYFQGVAGIEWHMIGHLQSRKTSSVVESFQWLHSLDSLHLAEKLNAALAASQKTLRVLIEMNVSGEESKFGWPAWTEEQWSNLLPEFERLVNFPQLKICGLMTMPPFN